MTRQYVAVKFRTADTRNYTYHNDGEPLAEGDQAKVEDARDGGWKRVFVVAIVDKPDFPTKPILGKVEPEPVDDGRDVFTALDVGLEQPHRF